MEAMNMLDTAALSLDDRQVKELQNLVRDSFRVRPNKVPIYVDVGNNLERILSHQHQIIFGRRGSGKSCLLIKAKEEIDNNNIIIAIYINADDVKTLEYPDLLIRLLLSVMEKLKTALPYSARLQFWKPEIRTLGKHIARLRILLDSAQFSEVTEENQNAQRRSSSSSLSHGPANVGAEQAVEQQHRRTAQFKERKLDFIQRHLQDYISNIEAVLKVSKKDALFVLLDDFYLIPIDSQPHVIDYMHRLFRNLGAYMKVGTIKHRTKLYSSEQKRIVGVELNQDVEEINLDKTLEDLGTTKSFLSEMLDKIAIQKGIDSVSVRLFNPEGIESLTLASGGVARDFLNIFVRAIDISLSDNSRRWLTPKYIWKASGQESYRTKLQSIKEEAEKDSASLDRVFNDLKQFCLNEKKKTAFLISQEEARQFPFAHELIQQLMDFKLLHLIEPDTSAASGRQGRYEAYTLDFSTFMEPRLRNITHVEFWKIDEQRRKRGVREAPIYPLSRAQQAYHWQSNEISRAS